MNPFHPISNFRLRPTQRPSATPLKPIVHTTATERIDKTWPLNAIIPVLRCAHDSSYLIRKRDEKVDRPGHYVAECSECRSIMNESLAPEDPAKMNTLQTIIPGLRCIRNASHAIRGRDERSSQPGRYHRLCYGCRVPDRRVRRWRQVGASLMFATRDLRVREDSGSMLQRDDRLGPRSGRDVEESPPSTQSSSPFEVLEETDAAEIDPANYDEESVGMVENGNNQGIIPPPRRNRISRLGHFAQPTVASLSRMGLIPRERIIPSFSNLSNTSAVSQREARMSSLAKITSDSSLSQQPIASQQIRVFESTGSSTPGSGNGGSNRPQRHDSGNDNEP